MSPLHTYPDNLILFLHSKYYLNSIKNFELLYRSEKVKEASVSAQVSKF